MVLQTFHCERSNIIYVAIKYILISVLFTSEVWCVYTSVVTLDQGKLVGLQSVLTGQKRYLSIPYATSQRFQRPGKPPKWRGVYKAVPAFDSCAQALQNIVFGREDCLHLDVHTPGTAEPGDHLPVLVFLHGGAYYFGSKNINYPEFLVKENLIVVSVNYRLGALGFLCIGEIANLGLLDQVAALKWIKKNIAAFGGNPDNVSLSGHSAGATSVGMHLLSRKSKGLFNKAILFSGNSFSPWAYNLEPKRSALADASKIAKFKVKDEKVAIEIFKRASLNEFLDGTRGFLFDSRYFKYTPCTDYKLKDPFFHDTPYNIIKSGDFSKVPVLTGVTDVEGLIFFGVNNQRDLQYWNTHFIDRLPSIFSWCSKEDKKKIAGRMRQYYFNEKNIDNFTAKELVKYYTDWIAHSTIDAFSRLIAKHSDAPVFNYVFSYVGDRNYFSTAFRNESAISGATHTDDLLYSNQVYGIPVPVSENDSLFVRRYNMMLANFVKYGNPTPHTTPLVPVIWQPTTADQSWTMWLDRELLVTKTPASLQKNFFLEMLCTYGQQGFVPCRSRQMCWQNERP